MKFKATPTFRRAFKRLQKKYLRLKEDVERLQLTLPKNSTAGVPLGSDLFKIRLASTDMAKGRRGAFRVIYYLMIAVDTIVLLDLYSKGT